MASIRCAHCKHIHTTIAEVKHCSTVTFERSECTRCFRSLTKVNGMWFGINGETYCPNGVDKHAPKTTEIAPTAEDLAFVRTAIRTTEYPLSELRQSLVNSIPGAPDGVDSMFATWLAAFDQIMAENTAQVVPQLVAIPVFVHAQGVDGKTLCGQHIASLNPAHVVADYLDLPESVCPNCVAYMKEIKKQAIQPVTEPGMYRNLKGTIYRVKYNKQGTHLYAERVTQETYYGKPKVVFTYMPGEIKNLTADMRMTIDTAKAANVQFGACCVCGRTLKAKTSVEAGIGPVCASKI